MDSEAQQQSKNLPKGDRGDFFKGLADSILSQMSNEDSASPYRQIRKQAANPTQMKYYVGSFLAKKREAQEKAENERKQFEQIIEQQSWMDNQINLLRKRYHEENYHEISRYCKNIVIYLKKNRVPNYDLYLCSVYFYWVKAELAFGNIPGAWKKFNIPKPICKEWEILKGEILVKEGKLKEAAELWEGLVGELEEEKVAFLEHEISRCYWEAGENSLSKKHGRICFEMGYQPWKCYAGLVLGGVSAEEGDFKAARGWFEAAREGAGLEVSEYINLALEECL